jgi:hypothetical protein
MQARVEISGDVFSNIPAASGWIPDVPTLASTRLQIELLLQQPRVDLRALAEVVLSDLSAILYVFRLVGEEFPLREDRPTRIADCIASLTFERWHDLIVTHCLTPNRELAEEAKNWRRVACCAREVAELVDGVSPEEAYLVGLFAEVERLPAILGWEQPGASVEEQKSFGLAFARSWDLPEFLTDAICKRHKQPESSPWNEILGLARTLAQRSRPLVPAEQASMRVRFDGCSHLASAALT